MTQSVDDGETFYCAECCMIQVSEDGDHCENCKAAIDAELQEFLAEHDAKIEPQYIR